MCPEVLHAFIPPDCPRKASSLSQYEGIPVIVRLDQLPGEHLEGARVSRTIDNDPLTRAA